jgi:hypothetical protein
MENHNHAFLLICLHSPLLQPPRHVVDATLQTLNVVVQASHVVGKRKGSDLIFM